MFDVGRSMLTVRRRRIRRSLLFSDHAGRFLGRRLGWRQK